MKESTRLAKIDAANELVQVRLGSGRIVDVARGVIEGTWGLEGQVIRRFKTIGVEDYEQRIADGWRVDQSTGKWSSPAKLAREALSRGKQAVVKVPTKAQLERRAREQEMRMLAELDVEDASI